LKEREGKTIPAKLILTPSKFHSIYLPENKGGAPIRLPDNSILPSLNWRLSQSISSMSSSDGCSRPPTKCLCMILDSPSHALSHSPRSKKVELMPRTHPLHRSLKKPVPNNPKGNTIVISSDSDVPSTGKIVMGSKTSSQRFWSCLHHNEDIIDLT
jgi:hypothetical protein